MRYAAVYENKIIQKHLPKEASIFNAESCTIDLPLNVISQKKFIKFIISSDFLNYI